MHIWKFSMVHLASEHTSKHFCCIYNPFHVAPNTQPNWNNVYAPLLRRVLFSAMDKNIPPTSSSRTNDFAKIRTSDLKFYDRAPSRAFIERHCCIRDYESYCRYKRVPKRRNIPAINQDVLRIRRFFSLFLMCHKVVSAL